MKKLLSLSLALIILMSVFSVNALASTAYVAKVVYQKDGTEQTLGQYSTLDDAFEALSVLYAGVLDANISDTVADEDTNNNNELYAAAGSPVIKLLCNFTGAYTCPDWVTEDYDMNNVPTIVVDGAKSKTENYKISCGRITLFDRLAFYNLTVRNVDMVFDNGSSPNDNNIYWNGNIDNKNDKTLEELTNPRIPGESFTVFENCYIDQNTTSEAATGDGGLFKMNGFKKALSDGDKVVSDIYNLTLKDCTIYSDTAVGLQVHWGADANIYLVNTTWTMDGNAGCDNNNDVILKCYEAGNVYINIDGTSKLIGERTEGSKTIALIRNIPNMWGSCTYELEEGAELYLNNSSSAMTEQYFIASICKNATLIDHGAIYKASDETVKTVGVTLPSLPVQGTGSIGYLNGDQIYTSGNTYKVAGNFTHAGYKTEDFGMLDGAAIRMVEGSYGVRFAAYISDDLLRSLGNNAEFGMVIAPGNDTSNDPSTNAKAITIKCKQLHKNTGNGDNVFYAAVLFDNEIDAKTACTTSLVAQAFYTMQNVNGEPFRIYTQIKSDNIRSIYQVAHTLASKDSSYSENPVISNVVEVATAIGADDIIAALAKDTVILNSSTTCKEVILSNVSKDAILNAFMSNGFTQISVNTVNGAKFETIVLRKYGELATIYWSDNSHEARIMWESVYENATDVLTPNENTGKGSIQVAQIGLERETETDNPLNGMCYIIKLGNGRAVIIDGGFNNICAQNIYNALGKLDIIKDTKGRYIIEAWIFSHPHGDHVGAIQKFASLYENEATVNYLMHNLPGDTKASTNEAPLVSRLNACYPNAKRINPHAGLKYYFDNLTISMLYTPELLYSYDGALGYSNDTSLIFKAEGGGASAMFYGDSGEKASEAMWNNYEASTFKVNILQITHHGLYTSANSSHIWEYVKKVYEATDATYAFLPMHSRYGTGTSRNGRYTVMIQWCNSGYQISFVMNENDDHGLSSISQAYYDAFVEAVASETNTYDTLYGYDGVNKIVSEEGLITYTGGNNFEPMVTIFSFENGEATLKLNQELYAWFE